MSSYLQAFNRVGRLVVYFGEHRVGLRVEDSHRAQNPSCCQQEILIELVESSRGLISFAHVSVPVPGGSEFYSHNLNLTLFLRRVNQKFNFGLNIGLATSLPLLSPTK